MMMMMMQQKAVAQIYNKSNVYIQPIHAQPLIYYKSTANQNGGVRT